MPNIQVNWPSFIIPPFKRFLFYWTKKARYKTRKPFRVLDSESCSVLSSSLPPHGLNSPWNSPGQNTGVVGAVPLSTVSYQPRDQTQVSHIAGRFFTRWATREAHWVLAAAAAAAKSLQSCLTLCDPIDGSLPGSSVPGVLQARTLEWVAIFSPTHESEKWKWSRSVLSNSLRPHGLQPTRLFRPWDFPGKSTGVGCHRLLWRNP